MGTICETPRLLLRRFTREDIEPFHLLVSDAETMNFWPAPFDLSQSQSWVERAWESYDKNGFGRYAVILKEENLLMGDCGFFKLPVDGVPEIDLGYIIGKAFWGQGIATEAAAACLRYGFEKLGFPRVVANMAVSHRASRRVAEKIGMKWEKTFLNARNRNLPTDLLAIYKS